MEASRVDMGMFGGTVLFLSEISCWNTKFGLIDWRGILNMTSGIFYSGKRLEFTFQEKRLRSDFCRKRIE